MAPWLVVGLGNPGPTYASHRHNVGYMVVDELASRARVRFSATRMRAEVAQTTLGDAGLGTPSANPARVVLAKPRTYMNESGAAVGKLAQYYEATPSTIIAIHDELDIDFGALRVKLGGGDNGHNGLKSLRKVLGTGDYYRVRFGIGRPPGRQEVSDFVLSGFPASQRTDLEIDIQTAADAVESLITDGLDKAQNRFNR